MSVEDVLAIHKLLADYNHLIDAGEAEAWADLFSDEATFDGGGLPPISGRAALVEFGRGVGRMIPGGRHAISNISIDVTGDTATSRCYLHLWVPGDGAPKVIMSGRYHDTLAKAGDDWRFTSRVMTPD